MTVYFAYGTNMSRTLMRGRCPAARTIGPAMLAGWRLMVTIDGYLSIVRRPGARIYGMLWRLTPRDLAALNIYEAVGSGLYRRQMLPVLAGGRRQAAHVYIGRSVVAGRPRPGHLPLVISAAQDWRLPAAYVDQLRRWAGSGWQGARAPESGEIR